MKTIAFYTLGCKVNQYDTEAMREILERSGYQCVDFDEKADFYLINTCTVTGTGDKKSRQIISRAHAKNPNAKIIVAGCYAQRAPQEVLLLPGVELVLGTKERSQIAQKLAALDGGRKNAVGDLKNERSFEEMSVTHEGRTRAHLKIQEGCDRFCSYCIIPYTRGPIRSRAIGDIKEQMRLLSDAGYSEIVLTGIHLMSYGKECTNGLTLLDAIAQAEDVEKIKRIRLGSLEPQLLAEAFVAALKNNPKICRQFHLSLQSGSDSVLARMRRRYTTDEYRRCVELLRAAMPGCAITTDVIVGFPGETESEFLESLSFVREIGFARIHVFPYSRREGTLAYSMQGQLSRNVKAKRAALMIQAGNELEAAYIRRFIGTRQTVLFEEKSDEMWHGYTDTYIRVGISASKDAELAGRLLPVKLERMDGLQVYGSLDQ